MTITFRLAINTQQAREITTQYGSPSHRVGTLPDGRYQGIESVNSAR
jgi:hypothetical protein